MRDKMVTLTFMVLTILLSGAKADPVEITQHSPCTEPKIRQVAFAAHFSGENVHLDRVQMVFDKVVTNIGDGYKVDDGRFEAPRSGTYTFRLQIMSAPGKGWIDAAVIFQNKTLCKAHAESEEFGSGFCTAYIQLKQGEIVYTKKVDGNPYVSGGMYNMFSGTLVSYDIK